MKRSEYNLIIGLFVILTLAPIIPLIYCISQGNDIISAVGGFVSIVVFFVFLIILLIFIRENKDSLIVNKEKSVDDNSKVNEAVTLSVSQSQDNNATNLDSDVSQKIAFAKKQTTIRVFLIIGMVLCFFLIYPIIVGVFAMGKLSTARSKSQMQGMAIVSTFFCSPIAGIMMMNLTDTELANNVPITVTKPKEPSLESELTELQRLVEKQLVSEDEYKELRAKLLSKY